MVRKTFASDHRLPTTTNRYMTRGSSVSSLTNSTAGRRHRSTVAYQAPSIVVDVSPGLTAGPGTRPRYARVPWTMITVSHCW
jgi:hypothetical protein